MALDAASNSPSSRSYFQKTVTLRDWWLIKPETDDAESKALGVAGRTSQQSRAARSFSSAPILKIYDLFELETVDGICVILQGLINKERTLENGFSPEVFNHFVMGFPPNWKEFATTCPKREPAAECVTPVQEADVKDSVEGPGDVHGKPQNCDSYTVDLGAQDCEDVTLSNRASTPLDPPSIENPQEYIIEAGNEILCEKSPVTPGFEDDLSVERSPVVSDTVDSSRRSKCLGVSSRRMTRSMKKMDNSKNSFLLVDDISKLDKETPIDPWIFDSSESLTKDINDVFFNNKKAVDVVDSDLKSKSRNVFSKLFGECRKGSNETASCSKETVLRLKTKRQRLDQNVDVVNTKDIKNGTSNQGKNKDDADVNDNIVLTSSKETVLRMKTIRQRLDQNVDVVNTKDIKNGTSNQGKNKDNADVDDNIVLTRSNMKGCRNKKKSRVVGPQKEGVSAAHKMKSKEASTTRNKSKTKLSVKRKLITSPNSARSTPSRAKKGSEERCGSANILSLESFSGKKSRSGRVVLPPLEFWRNQKLVYDEDRQVCGVQEAN